MTDGTTENPVSSNITEVHHAVDQRTRWLLNGHRGGVLWLTGLSGSGKSTIGVALERRLLEKGWRAYMLDGDNVRHRLNRDLGFSPEDRKENIRRIGEVAALFAESGVIVITCFISPYRDDRRMARDAAGDAFHEIHLSTSLETCEERDPKGLYKKARAGMIQDFTGISAPYEVPLSAELTLDTGALNLTESLDTLEQYIQTHFLYLGEEASAAAS